MRTGLILILLVISITYENALFIFDSTTHPAEMVLIVDNDTKSDAGGRGGYGLEETDFC